MQTENNSHLFKIKSQFQSESTRNFIFDCYDSEENTFYLIKASRVIQQRYRAYLLRKRIKKKLNDRKNESEDDIISQVSEENDVQSLLKNKERLNTSQSGSNYFLTQAQTQNISKQLSEIDMIKGNFLMKTTPFTYIENPDVSRLKRLHQSIAKLRGSNVFGTLQQKTHYFGLLKWKDGSILKGRINRNLFPDKEDIESPDETKNNNQNIIVNGPAIFINKPLNYSFIGEYKKNRPYGYGLLSYLGDSLEGIWNGRNLKGIGEEILSDETFYRGEFDKGMKNGIGIYRWPDGTIYQGEWKDNQMKGLGCIIYLDDRIYEGEIDNGAMDGIGRFRWPDGKFYYGQYENNVKSGFGIFVWNNSPLEAYAGFWVKGKPDGQGVKLKGNTMKYGLWRNGKNKKYYGEIWELKDTLDEDQLPYFIFMEKASSYIAFWKKK